MTQTLIADEEEPRTIVPSRRAWAMVGYLSFLCLLPLFAKRDDDFVLFHARQGLLLFVAALLFLVLSVVPLFGHALWHLGDTVIFVLSLLGIYYALRGQRWTMPLIGDAAREITV